MLHSISRDTPEAHTQWHTQSRRSTMQLFFEEFFALFNRKIFAIKVKFSLKKIGVAWI